MKIPITLKPRGKGRARLSVGDRRIDLVQGEYTGWDTLTFKASFGITVTGIARFLLTETRPELSLHSTPININPEDPALPISHPTYYAPSLAKLLGAYCTLGM